MNFKSGEAILPVFDGWMKCLVTVMVAGKKVNLKIGPVSPETMEGILADPDRAEIRAVPTHLAKVGEGLLRVWPIPAADYEIVVQ